MDIVLTINRIRSDFLKNSEDRDQLNRVLKPFLSGAQPIKNLYFDEDGLNLLEDIESPPITESYLNNSEYKGRTTIENSSDKLYCSRENLTESSLNIKTGLSDDIVESVQMKLVPSPTSVGRTRSHSILGDQGSLKYKALKPLQKRTSDNSLQTVASKASEKSTRNKKSRLKLGRLFRTSSLLNSETSDKGTRRSTSFSKPFNFYDQKLYAHDGIDNFEDDDDDDDDKYEYDKGAVLNFFGKEKTTNSSASIDERLKIGRKSSFLETFPLNPHNILQFTDTTDSNSSVHKFSTVNDKNLKSAEKDAVSYVESYFNQPDIGQITNLDNFNSQKSSEEKSVTIESADVQKRSNKDNEKNVQISYDTSENDDISSYGKSLLDSEFSGDEFQASSLPPSDYSSIDFSFRDIPNNSIPRSRALTLSHSDNGSTLDTELQKATQLFHLATNVSRESLPHSVSREFFDNKKRNSSDLPRENKLHTVAPKGLPKNTSDPINSLNKRQNGEHIRTSSDITQDRIKKNKEPEKTENLVVRKVDLKRQPIAKSNLSALFTRSHYENLNPLEYFSTISSEKVLPKDSLKLDVYIQPSSTYRRTPFPISIKKSATVFEVLGYCLYCYTTNFKPKTTEGEILLEETFNPNNFTLKIVDEGGEPFEDNFGILERTQTIGKIFDTEVVVCRVDNNEQFEKNEEQTPLPYNFNYDAPGKVSERIGNINQLSYYTSILPESKKVIGELGPNVVTIKVFLYPNVNPQFNFTSIKISVTSKINDILIQYCKLKNLDATEYVLKMERKKILLDLNDHVTSLDGNYNLEVLKKKDAKSLNLERMKAYVNPPGLPTIQSNDLTPLTSSLAIHNNTLNHDLNDVEAPIENTHTVERIKSNSKYRLHKGKHNTLGGTSQSFFKLKNSSKTSIGSAKKSTQLLTANEPTNIVNSVDNYKDILSGAYYKYRVWRRQQMSFISKHERSLVIDGDYVYISGPEGDFNWNHENFKTKSFHVSQISLVKRSRRVDEYFKIFVMRPDRERRYYFAAVSPEQCVEIVARLQKLVKVYKMNHK